jgi:hypothetical protein
VPGAKKIMAKLAPATELLVESDFVIYLNSPQMRAKITGAKILKGFRGLKNDWRRFVAAMSCAEIGLLLTPYYSQNIARYKLLLRTFELIETSKNPWRIFNAFILRFLKLSGYNFTDYIKKENIHMDEQEYNMIKKLSTLSGLDVANNLEIPKHMENRVSMHLAMYLPRALSTKKFLAKIDI